MLQVQMGPDQRDRVNVCLVCRIVTRGVNCTVAPPVTIRQTNGAFIPLSA